MTLSGSKVLEHGGCSQTSGSRAIHLGMPRIADGENTKTLDYQEHLPPQGNSQSKPQLASVFVDSENVFYTLKNDLRSPHAVKEMIYILAQLLMQLKEAYNLDVLLGRAYGDYVGPLRAAWKELGQLGIQQIGVNATRSKNSADLKLSLDACQMLYTRKTVNCIVIVGGDRDYLPLVNTIHSFGKKVILVGFDIATSRRLRSAVGEENYLSADALRSRN
jgi:uncharacterized LabA/DUF88 family protein